MNIAIITAVSGISSKKLAKALIAEGVQATVFKPFDMMKVPNWGFYDAVFSYGCSAGTPGAKKRLNTKKAVLTCVDKCKTFSVFEQNGIPTVRNWVDRNAIPNDVQSLVIRQDPCGRKAEDIQYWDRWEGKPIPIGGLYSEWYPHQREYRLTVFNGEPFLYYKKYVEATHEHHFMFNKSPMAKNMKDDAVKAAKALGIDFVSFDILSNGFKDYVFLEANSGTLLTDEVEVAIVDYFKKG